MTVAAGRYLDTLGMWEAIGSVPAQIRAAAETERPQSRGTAVMLTGVGLDRVAADAVSALLAPTFRYSVRTGGGPDLPAFIDEHALVVALCSQGPALETINAVRVATGRGAAASCLAPEGNDVGLAHTQHLWLSMLGTSGRSSALTATAVALAHVAQHVGAEGPVGPSLALVGESLATRVEKWADPQGPAAELARHIGRTIPLFLGSDGLGAVAARYWALQCNRLVKTPAFATSLSDEAYGGVSGWGQNGDVTRQVFTLVPLRLRGEDRVTSERISLVMGAMDEVMAGVHEVWGEGDDVLGRFFDLALFGDFVALHLAGREGIDPGPLAVTPEDD